MKNIVDKMQIIGLKKQGFSNRAVAKMTKSNRKTIGKYWNEYLKCESELLTEKDNIREIQEKIIAAPKYNSDNRTRRKFTDEISIRLNEILEAEKLKDKILGSHKQQLTKKQIYEILIAEGYDISNTTISNEIKRIRNSVKECFVRQEYDFGDRLEYDFGEVKLVINNILRTYHMAVLSSPGGNFRWSFLYTNQKKDVFMDSHVKFFEMVGGVYREVVYDNMKNVVTKFIGRNEKELNQDLVKMSIYYGFNINVTNCFSGNEKGYVESSVKILRNQIFATNFRFNSLEDAQEYLNSQLLKLNESSAIEEEKKCLLPYKPKLELATISENEVNSYSFIHVDNNFYSVPEYLVGKRVVVKTYFDEIFVYSNNEKVCTHKRLDGHKAMKVDIHHYLNTLSKKPGAIRNSLALKSIPMLKAIFDKYYSKKPKKFIEIFMQNKHLQIDEIMNVFTKMIAEPTQITAIEVIRGSSIIDIATRNQTTKYNSLCISGGLRI
jgi:transposase